MPTTNYIWDDQNYLAETDGSNGVQTVHTNEPQQYGNLISSRISGTTSYYHFDALGSTRQLTNVAGTVTDTVVYDAWGNVVNRTGTTPVVRLWVGQFEYSFDLEIETFWISRRPVDPNTGRWTTVDPAKFVDGLNLYGYVANQPNLQVDPFGLAACLRIIGVLGPALIPGPPLYPVQRPQLKGRCRVADEVVIIVGRCPMGYDRVPFKRDGQYLATFCILCQPVGVDPCRVVDDFTGKLIEAGRCIPEVFDNPDFGPESSCDCSFPPKNPPIFS